MKYSELIEKKRHGTTDFPVEYYHVDKSHPRYVMPPHWHKEFEIIRVICGRLTVYLNSVKYELSDGDSLFVEGGCLKRAYPNKCVYECLVFDASILDSRISNTECEYKSLISHSDTPMIDTVNRLFEAMSESLDFYELRVFALLYELFYEMYSAGYIQKRRNRTTDNGAKTVVSILQWIDSHNTEQITLSAISEMSGLSEKYLCRIFKEYTARTIMEYVNESRVERACTAMATLSITETAFACGFNDLSYFCKTFKKYKKSPPASIRRGILKNNGFLYCYF